ncbi:aminotransferase family protein-like protein [Xylariaceae sp. FL0804]|nr:aminotransferase family protein-like protein [Xylariaceae sp. FL0804]
MAAFGRSMRHAHFSFAPSYTPLNHGSFGACPAAVLDRQAALRRDADARPDTFIRLAYPALLRRARRAVAPLLGLDVDADGADEVVFVPNALTGINTALRNLAYEEGDVIVYFSTIYDACRKTIQSLEETTPVRGLAVDLSTYPDVEDDEVVDRFCAAILQVRMQGRRARLALFDTVLAFPGVRFPWEALVETCRRQGILSCVDGAHGVGHIDLSHVARLSPDFFISNCYKWLMVPRGCALFYVPRRNHHLIQTTFPTAEGYLPPADRRSVPSPTAYFVGLFEKVSTIDVTPYACVPAALEFRDRVCGGEARVREYCTALAREGGELMAGILGTEVMENRGATLRRGCCFANVRLPLDLDEIADALARCPGDRGVGSGSGVSSPPPSAAPSAAAAAGGDAAEAKMIADWITERSINEFDSFLATRYYNGAFWTRLSSQIYLEKADFEWAARVLMDLCSRVKEGRWREGRPPPQ